MLVKLTASIPNEIPLEGIQMGINYGFEKVRFINPVLSGKRIGPRPSPRPSNSKAPRQLHPHDHGRNRGRRQTGPRRRLDRPHRLRLLRKP